MNATEKFLFDCHGFIHVPKLLPPRTAQRLLTACKELEADARTCEAGAARFRVNCGFDFWRNDRFGYLATDCNTPPGAATLLIDDFWLFSDDFDLLVGHEPTQAYVRELIGNRSYRATSPAGFLINNAELRIRYPGNASAAHMGYPRNTNRRFSYHVDRDDNLNAGMVRMVYFLHDVAVDEGPICFIPGSHKSHFEAPAGPNGQVEEEPGMVPVPVRVGDGVLFTEACRHGGFTNRSAQTRYTLHVGYAPDSLASHNLSSQDGPMNVTEAFLERLRPEQRSLLVRAEPEAIVPAACGVRS